MFYMLFVKFEGSIHVQSFSFSLGTFLEEWGDTFPSQIFNAKHQIPHARHSSLYDWKKIFTG